MRTVGGLHGQISDRANLTAAVWLAAKGRRRQGAVRDYLGNLEGELDDLRGQLTTGEIRCGECHTFTIHDPKQRLITAPVFRERVLHHAVMRICGPVLDRRLIYHSYACRVGKGTFAALDAARRAAQANGWFLKLDVRRYFANICHERLLRALGRVFRERKIIDMFGLLLAAYASDGGRGLPIGTLVSQHLANFYLAALDSHIVQGLRPRGYVRYMDDMAVWAEDAPSARTMRTSIVDFAREKLDLEMRTAFINRCARGMDFLGGRVFPRRIGLNRASRRRYGRRIRSLDESLRFGRISEDEAQERAVALTAFTRHAACVRWRRRVLATLGDGPQAGNGCCAAGAGSTTAGTPDPPTATATSQRTVTRTAVSVPVPAPAGGRSARMEPACPPVPPRPAVDETETPCCRPVTPAASAARSQGGQRGARARSEPRS